jgi:hypothetical protein
MDLDYAAICSNFFAGLDDFINQPTSKNVPFNFRLDLIRKFLIGSAAAIFPYVLILTTNAHRKNTLKS